ncbi:MAG: DUF3368 domain-containing protein [Burkholderiales bacterium]|nr:DUF3368 domain-containing protein [Burkholderiales bacterium]
MSCFGAVGVLVQARRIGKLKRIEPVLQRLQNHGYRLSQSLVDAALKAAGERSSD